MTGGRLVVVFKMLNASSKTLIDITPASSRALGDDLFNSMSVFSLYLYEFLQIVCCLSIIRVLRILDDSQLF